MDMGDSQSKAVPAGYPQIGGELEKKLWLCNASATELITLARGNGTIPLPVGNGMGKPPGIAPATHIPPVEQPYPKPHGFTHQNKPKNIQIGQVLREIYSK